MIASHAHSATRLAPAALPTKDCKFIADQLSLTADLLELLTGSSVEPDHYREGASLLRLSPALQQSPLTANALAAIEGLTRDVLADAQALLQTGDTELLVRLRERIPATVRAMLPLHGLGPKRLRAVWRDMGILDAASLSLAIMENRLLHQPGFGPKTQAKIKDSLAAARLQGNLFALSDLRPIATLLEHELRELLGPEARFDLTGAYRRGCTCCESIELLVEPDHYKSVLLHLIQCAHYEILTAGQDMILARARDTNVPLRFYFQGVNYYLELFRTTGSPEHVASIPVNPNKRYRSEAEIYADAGLPYIPASLRESVAEITQAKRRGLPKLVHYSDIRGILHALTTASDGCDNLETMAKHAQAMGMEYLGISDHGPMHVDGRGLSLDAIKQQHREIDRLNGRMQGFKVLKGIELDIQEDGGFGMRDIDLVGFDFVIASLHVAEPLSVADATMRLVRAVRNPFTTILGHATGRLLFGTEGHPVNVETVIDACARHGVAIELNCNPLRMDLDWKWIRYAVSQGVMVAINPDAHSAEALHDIENGISEARKGMLTPTLTLNALSLAEIEEQWLARRNLRMG